MALICLFVISTLAVGVLYSSQSEIWTTANYRAVTQARYVAEAGAQQALNYLQSTNPITSSSTFTSANFGLSAMPITYTATSKPLVISTSGISSKYADTYSAIDTALGTSVDSAFQTYFSSAITQTPFAGMTPGCSGSVCPHFNVAVQLLTAFYNSTSGTWLTRWKIVSEGSLNTVGSNASTGKGQAMVQVVEVVDNVMTVASGSSLTPTYGAALVATGTGCGAINMTGSQTVNSYVGASYPGNTNPPLANTGGNIISFGNINMTGSGNIYGSIYSPFYNTGATGTYGISATGTDGNANGGAGCSTSGTEYAVNIVGSAGVGCTSSSCSDKTYTMPSPAPTYPTPILPAVTTNTATCSFVGSTAVTLSPTTMPTGCTGTGSGALLNYGNVSITGSAAITLQAGTYNMNSLTITGSASLIMPASGNVVINILGSGSSAPLTLTGSSVANNGGVPSDFTVVYAGTQPITLTGSQSMFVSVYAPNAAATITGSASIYGSVVCKTANLTGSASLAYDSSLAGTSWNVNTGTPTSTPGVLHVDEFSWSAF